MSSLWWLGTAVQAAREDGIGAYETIGHEKAAIATGTQQNSSPRPKDEGHDLGQQRYERRCELLLGKGDIPFREETVGLDVSIWCQSPHTCLLFGLRLTQRFFIEGTLMIDKAVK